MKKLFLVFLLLQIGLFAQLNNTNKWIMRGDDVTLSFNYKTELTNDTLIFVAKASKDITAVRLIEKTTYDNEISLSGTSRTSIFIPLSSGDTDDLTLSRYFYDITRIKNGDTTTIIIGELYLQPDIGTPFDGTDVTGRVTTVSLNNGTINRELLWWDSVNELWEPSGITFSSGGSVGNADSLNGIPASGYLVLNDSLDQRTFSNLKYVDKTTSQTITAQKNFIGNIEVGTDTSLRLESNGSSSLISGRTRFQITSMAIDTFAQNKLTFDHNTFNGDYDPMVFLGYNIFNAKTSHPSLYMGIEGYYNNGANIISEYYIEKYDRTGITYRPFGVTTYDGYAATDNNVDKFNVFTKGGHGGYGSNLPVLEIVTTDTPNVAHYTGNWNQHNGIFRVIDFADTIFTVTSSSGVGIGIGGRAPTADLEVSGSSLFTGSVDVTSGKLNMNTVQSTLGTGLARYTGNYMIISDYNGSGLGAYRSLASAYAPIVIAADDIFYPANDGLVNLGDASFKFKNGYFSGVIDADSLDLNYFDVTGNWVSNNGSAYFVEFGDTNIVIKTGLGIGLNIGGRAPTSLLEVNGSISVTGNQDIISGVLNMNTVQTTLPIGLARYTGNYMIINDYEGSGLGAYNDDSSKYLPMVLAVNGFFKPFIDDKISLGDPSFRFTNLHLSGDINADSIDTRSINTEALYINGILQTGEGSIGNADSLGALPASRYLLKSDSTIYLTPSDAANAYATVSHTHTEFADTIIVAVWGVMDTVTTGDYVGKKIENNYTITEVGAYTNSGTVTFNIEERVETTPNTAGVDVMTSDLVADTDQQETSTFSNAAIDRDDWLVLVVTSITGDPTIFSITVRGVKTN